MSHKFQTRYTRKDFEKTYEKNEGGSRVERAGYISAKQRIENIMYAGQRLKAARAEMYDFTGEEWDEENDFDDPTRAKGYDLADATQDALEVEARLKKQAKNAKIVEIPQNTGTPKGQPLPEDLKSKGE